MPRYEDLATTLFTLTGQQSDGLFVHRAFVKFAGSLEAGLLLSQLLYWTPRARVQLKDDNGDQSISWIAKTDADFMTELCLTQYALRQARRQLEDLGVLETRVAKFAGVPTVHYRLAMEALIDAWVAWCRKNDLANSQNPFCESTESSTETTPETTTPPPMPAEVAAEPASGRNGGGGDGDVSQTSSQVDLPSDVLTGLAAIQFRRQPQALQEVAQVFAAHPDYVRGWLAELQRHPEQYNNPAGFFRRSVLREKTPLPCGQPASQCERCGGAGYLLDGDHAIPCPVCHPAGPSAPSGHSISYSGGLNA
jgi:hypothetical protein